MPRPLHLTVATFLGSGLPRNLAASPPLHTGLPTSLPAPPPASAAQGGPDIPQLWASSQVPWYFSLLGRPILPAQPLGHPPTSAHPPPLPGLPRVGGDLGSQGSQTAAKHGSRGMEGGERTINVSYGFGPRTQQHPCHPCLPTRQGVLTRAPARGRVAPYLSRAGRGSGSGTPGDSCSGARLGCSHRSG